MGLIERAKNVARDTLRVAASRYLGFADAPAPPLVDEVSAESTVAGAVLLEPRDEILKSHGKGDLALYERLLTDDQVWSTFRQRRTEVIAREWRVDPGGEDEIDKLAADDLRAQMVKLSWDRTCYKMLSGLMYGYGVGECMFALEEGTDRVLLSRVKVRRSARFGFAPDTTLRIKRAGKVEELPERKFWVYSCGSDNDDDPYGLGMGHPLYWPVWLKRNGLKFWALFLEYFANPTAKAVVPPGTEEGDRKKLLEVLGRIRNGGKIVVPRGVDVELIQSIRSSGGDFEQFLARLDACIAKIVLMQTMTTDQGSSLSQAQIHYKVGQQGAKSDSDLLDESFCQGPAKWLTEWNYPGAKTPIVYRDFGIAEDLKALADRDQVLNTMGWRPRPEYIAQTYGDNYDFVAPTDPLAGGSLGLPAGDVVTDPSATVAAAVPEAAQIELAPTDLVTIVTVNEARGKLGPLKLPDGGNDPDGFLTVAAFRAKSEAKGAVVGEAAGATAVPGDPAFSEWDAAFARFLESRSVDLADPLPTGSVDNLMADDGWRKLIGPQVEGVEALLASCHTLEEFRDRIGELALSDPEQMTEALSRIMFTARVAGNVSAEEPDGDND